MRLWEVKWLFQSHIISSWMFQNHHLLNHIHACFSNGKSGKTGKSHLETCPLGALERAHWLPLRVLLLNVLIFSFYWHLLVIFPFFSCLLYETNGAKMMTFLYSFSMVCRREPSCFSFLGLPWKKSPQVIFSGLEEKNAFSRSSGVQMYKIRCWHKWNLWQLWKRIHSCFLSSCLVAVNKGWCSLACSCLTPIFVFIFPWALPLCHLLLCLL